MTSYCVVVLTSFCIVPSCRVTLVSISWICVFSFWFAFKCTWKCIVCCLAVSVPSLQTQPERSRCVWLPSVTPMMLHLSWPAPTDSLVKFSVILVRSLKWWTPMESLLCLPWWLASVRRWGQAWHVLFDINVLCYVWSQHSIRLYYLGPFVVLNAHYDGIQDIFV